MANQSDEPVSNRAGAMEQWPLQQPGEAVEVSGRLVYADNGSPFPHGYEIHFTDRNSDQQFMYYDYGWAVKDVFIPPTPEFNIFLPPGAYAVAIRPFDIRFNGTSLYNEYASTPGTLYTDSDQIAHFTMTVEPSLRLDLGDITVSRLHANVTGKVIPEFDAPVTTTLHHSTGGVWIGAFKPGAQEPQFATEADSEREYWLDVSPGIWEIGPLFLDHPEYGHSGKRERVIVTESGQSARVEFAFTPKNSKVVGTIVDENGAPIPAVNGEIYAYTSYDNSPTAMTPLYETSGQVVNGRFELDLIPGRYILSLGDGPTMEPNGYYGTTLISIGENETLEVDLPVQQATGLITADLLSVREPGTAISVTGRLTVTLRNGHFELQQVLDGPLSHNPSDVSFAVVPGRWRLDWELADRCHIEYDVYGSYEVCAFAGYVSDPSPISVDVQANESVQIDLPAYATTTEVYANLLSPSGHLVPVSFWPDSILVYTGRGQLEGWSRRLSVESQGQHRVYLPYGEWALQAMPPFGGWYASEPISFSLAEDGFTKIDVQLQGPNAVLSGTVTALNMTESQTATLQVETIGSGFSDQEIWLTSDGVHASGSYSLPIRSGVLRVSGMVGDEQATLWSGAQTAEYTEEMSLDLTLYPQGVLPHPPFNRFYATDNVRMYVNDGAQVEIPAGTVSGEGIYEARITPGYHYRYDLTYLPLGHGYEIKIATIREGDPISLPFSEEIVWRLPISAKLPYKLIPADQVRVAAYSPLDETWTILSHTEMGLEGAMITVRSSRYNKVALVIPHSALIDPADLNFAIYVPAIYK